MIPQNNISKMFFSLAGEKKLFSMALSNMGHHMKDLQAMGAHAYVAHNGQTENGYINNGRDRLYWWPNTEIDGSYLPNFKESPDTAQLIQSISDDPKFQSFKEHIEGGSDNALSVEPYVGTGNAQGTVRLGMCITAESNEDFQKGLESLDLAERPEDYGSAKIKDRMPRGRMFKNMDHD